MVQLEHHFFLLARRPHRLKLGGADYPGQTPLLIAHRDSKFVYSARNIGSARVMVYVAGRDFAMASPGVFWVRAFLLHG